MASLTGSQVPQLFVYRYYRDEQQSLEPEDVAAVVKQRQDPQELLRQAEEQAEAAEVVSDADFAH